MTVKMTVFVVATVILVACDKTPSEAPLPGRWYTPTQLALGKTVFKNNCAVCHGEQAQGLAADWRKRLADGSFPPPPLNGSAHAWHHPMSVLLATIQEGGAPVGGVMPAFKNRLNESQQRAAIAYFQNFWPEQTYRQWQQLGGVNK